jgi:hypothetical protein
MDIVAFLSGCLDEYQARAEAALAHDPAPWTADATDTGTAGQSRMAGGFGVVINASDGSLWDCEGSSTLCMTAPAARFVAANDPARVLADIAAKRRVLARHQPSSLGGCEGCGWDDREGCYRYEDEPACPELRDAAAPFADRPGYNPAWAVNGD